MSLGPVKAIHVSDRHPVHDVQLDVSRLTVLIGRNDSGKSTLLSCVADILSPSLPPADRPGWWIPTAELAASTREHLGWAAKRPVQLVGDEHGAGTTVRARSGEALPELPSTLAAQFAIPVASIVKIEPGTSERRADRAVRVFLLNVVADTIDAGTPVGGSPSNPEDPLHFIDAHGTVRPWTASACEMLAAEAFGLMPPFVRSNYERVSIDVASTEDGGWDPTIALVNDYGRCPHDELASGVRTWLNLALAEAARRLADDLTVISNDGVVREDHPDRSTLFLVDEPEQHLHPQAALEIAEWFYSLSQQPGFGVVVATHSPAFIGLASRPGVEVVVCSREDLPDDGVSHTVTSCRRWTSLQLNRLSEHATTAGITIADAFLTGTTPVLVEGRHDLYYFARAWQLVTGSSADSLGIRIIPISGIPNLELILSEMVERLYPPGSPVFLITDDTSLDSANSGRLIERTRIDHPHLEVRAHDAFDVLALVPEQRYREAGINVRSTWATVNAKRRKRRATENRSGRQGGGPWPGKEQVLDQPTNEQLAAAITSVSRRQVPQSVVHIITEITARATSGSTGTASAPRSTTT
jgi:energy-coupling factor transporter ATP-binding protein EcfA2